jgi:hypothetical protein
MGASKKVKMTIGKFLWGKKDCGGASFFLLIAGVCAYYPLQVRKAD